MTLLQLCAGVPYGCMKSDSIPIYIPGVCVEWNESIIVGLFYGAQRSTDPDTLELFAKKVQMVDKRSGNVTNNWLKPADGMRQTKAGGK